VKLSWTPPNDDGDVQAIGDYMVTWFTNNSNEKTDYVEGNSTEIKNLQSNTRYTFSVAARSENSTDIIGERRTGNEITRKLWW